MIELRRYAVLPGRMDDMHARMSGMLLPLFAEYGVPAPLAVWENRDRTSTLTWTVEWPDFETRQAAWARLHPVFAAARLAEGTPEFVTRTTLTVLAPWPGATLRFGRAGGCEAAWHVQPRIGFGAAFAAACADGVFARLRATGATSVNASNLLFGALPQAFVLLGWPDVETRRQGMARIAGEALGPALEDALLGDGATFGDRGEWELLDRAPYLDLDRAI